MSGPLAAALVCLGLAVVTVQRRLLAVALVTAQALLLVGLSARQGLDARDALAASALAARALALAAFLSVLVTRTRDPRPVRAGVPPLTRAALAAGLAVTLVWLVPAMGLRSRGAEQAVLALVAFGLVLATTHRATVFQVLGVIMIENGLALAALELPGSSALVETGVALDLVLIALVAGAFHTRIFAAFGAGDTRALRSLRD